MQEDQILLSDPQYDFLTSKKKHTGFVAGFGSGKSFIGTLKSLMKVIDGIPKTAYYLPTYGDIRDIAFDGFPVVAEMLGYKFKLNKSDKEFFLLDHWGKEIGKTIFRNMSEPESIIGYQVGYSLIDETDILKMDKMDLAYKKILGRNRLVVPVKEHEILQQYQATGIPPIGTYWHETRMELCYVNLIDVAGTPEGFKWFHKRFVKEKGDDDLLIKASTYSNLENLPADFIDTLAAEYPPNLFSAYVNGDFVNLTSGQVYSYFDRDKHHTDAEIEEREHLYIGQDFNVGGCCGRVFVIRKGKPMLLEEYSVYDTHSIIEHVTKTYKNKGHFVEFCPDASGDSRSTNSTKSDLQLLRDAGFRVNAPAKNPFVMDRVNTVNTLLYKENLLINTYKCPESTDSLEQQAYDKNGEPEKFDGAGTVDDSNDAIGYFLYRYFGIDRQAAKVISKR